MTWNPHTLFHCLNSDWLAWVTIISSIFVVVGYGFIVVRVWLPAARVASHGARSALLAMATIFIFCAVAGYGTLVIAAWAPEIAYAARAASLVILNLAIICFLRSRVGYEFTLIGHSERVGRSMIEQYKKEMSDKEIASLARRVIAESLVIRATNLKAMV